MFDVMAYETARAVSKYINGNTDLLGLCTYTCNCGHILAKPASTKHSSTCQWHIAKKLALLYLRTGGRKAASVTRAEKLRRMDDWKIRRLMRFMEFCDNPKAQKVIKQHASRIIPPEGRM